MSGGEADGAGGSRAHGGAGAPPDVLERLSATLAARRGADPASSYAASLYARGEDAILRKVGEESIELLLAAKSGDAGHLVAEAADVWFHMLVLMAHKGLGAADILGELARREGLSGHDEKAARPPSRPDPAGAQDTGVTRP